MATKAQLKNYFKTGEIPTGEHFAEFIDAFVAYVNDNTPDSDGRVSTDFQMIEARRLDVLCSDYPEGLSEFVLDYDKSEYADYISSNPTFDQLESGRIAVRTFKYSNPTVCYQQIDNLANGIFHPAFYRSETVEGNWGELIKVEKMPVKATTAEAQAGTNDVNFLTSLTGLAQINNFAMVKKGNIITGQSLNNFRTIGIHHVTGAIPGLPLPLPCTLVIFETASTSTNRQVVQMLITRPETSTTPQRVAIRSYSEESSTWSNWTHVATDSNIGLRSNLTTTDKTTIVAAINEVLAKINNHSTLLASPTVSGHVKVDGTTITINQEGVISAVQAPVSGGYVKRVVYQEGTIGSNDHEITIPSTITNMDGWFIEVEKQRLYSPVDYTVNTATNTIYVEDSSVTSRGYRIMREELFFD